MIRVALLDDHPVVIAGLTRLLEHTPEISVLASASDEVALTRALGQHRPDVLIVDYDLARGDALALCRRIKARRDPVRVLIYSAYASPGLAIAARISRADGVIDKADPAATLVDAIRRIAEGGNVIPDVSHDDLAAASARLDRADRRVLAMLLDGESFDAIAETLRSDERDVARRTGRLVARLRPRLAADEWPQSPRLTT